MARPVIVTPPLAQAARLTTAATTILRLIPALMLSR
jgi:hypothetical protein